jgi:hypothetical protein
MLNDFKSNQLYVYVRWMIRVTVRLAPVLVGGFSG